jgi:hypothetical protein
LLLNSQPGERTVFADFRIDQFASVGLEPFERAFLIDAHQARVPRDIGGEDRGEAAGSGYSGRPAFRKPSSQILMCSGLR